MKANSKCRAVVAVREPVVLPTYGVGRPEKCAAFFERRVYQGSCGKTYPVPFIDKVFDTPEDRRYDSVRLENDSVRLVVLPEIGGRLFIGQDKTNADYDFFYRQDVIKPALVGLAGPWISGGVEFNWPQHHRPGTFMPADVHIEEEEDGAKTVWLSEHDPIHRMKGMHGIRLRPGSSLIELRARLFNRTPLTQTFLWWANAAVRVHDRYQSFFPPDVRCVVDHAERATSRFPIAEGVYYGVDYGKRPGANDLRWYKNIPVPTSYMVHKTAFGFLGGYDFEANGGVVHVANRHIAPGKKQWTWGNHAFGWAWDRELTDRNGPYLELMAGVYTDNQPDFSYLLPYETKTFSQFWWPYKNIGPVQNANEKAAVRLVVREDRRLDLGVAVPAPVEGARIVLNDGARVLLDVRVDLTPGSPWQNQTVALAGDAEDALGLTLEDASGHVLVAYRVADACGNGAWRSPATEPAEPAQLETAEELYLTGEHLEQYRHPTFAPERYWDEALRRDPLDARSNIALGRRLLQRGLFRQAAEHLGRAVSRLTQRHPNPVTGEAHYYLGLTRRFEGLEEEAYAMFYKATWNYEWRAAGYYELATLDCRRKAWEDALDHIERSLDAHRQNGKAHVLKAAVLRKVGRGQKAQAVLAALLESDPLDHWARYEFVLAKGDGDFRAWLDACRNDAQTVLDIAYDYADAGFYEEALLLLKRHQSNEGTPVAVENPLGRSQMTAYTLAWLEWQAGLPDYVGTLSEARRMTADYLFPSRLHEQRVLEWALKQSGEDPNAAYGLGNYCYDRRRHEEAIILWEMSAREGQTRAMSCRNLGIAYWNVRRDGDAALAAYRSALQAERDEPRLFYEFDQLRKKLNEPVESRLVALQERLDLVESRDDCTVELATLYNLTGRPEKALALLSERRFHPWEGGEGQVVRQYTVARLLLGQRAGGNGDWITALEHFQLAMQTPPNLGEAYHLLQAKADVTYWTGKALRALGRENEAVRNFEASASETGDFLSMAVAAHSPLSYFRGLALRELGRESEAQVLFEGMKKFALEKLGRKAKADYFATSLPELLVFEEDPDERQRLDATYLQGLAERGLGNEVAAVTLLGEVHAARPAHQGVADWTAVVDRPQ